MASGTEQINTRFDATIERIDSETPKETVKTVTEVLKFEFQRDAKLHSGLIQTRQNQTSWSERSGGERQSMTS